MIRILLFVATYFSSPSVDPEFKICLGERCKGDNISLAYLEKNHVLTCNLKDYTVQSFTAAFDAGSGTILDIQVNGNDLAPILPRMQTIKSGSKLYLDDITVKFPNGTHRKTSSVFIVE